MLEIWSSNELELDIKTKINMLESSVFSCLISAAETWTIKITMLVL